MEPIMRIDHLINGKSVAGSDYFETVNPATQEVLAEVAAGGEAEVNAAVAAAKEAFPKWAGDARAAAREADPQAGRPDRGARARDRADRDQRHAAR